MRSSAEVEDGGYGDVVMKVLVYIGEGGGRSLGLGFSGAAQRRRRRGAVLTFESNFARIKKL